MGRKRVAQVRGEGKAGGSATGEGREKDGTPDSPEQPSILNVYRVDSHITHTRDGHQVARPGSHKSQLVAAESAEAAIAGAAKARGEGFEVAHVSNAHQGVLVVPPQESAKRS